MPSRRMSSRARQIACADGVRLRRAREIRHCLGEVELRLRQPYVLHRLRRGHRDDEPHRVGVADVLARGDHDPAGEEARVLASLEHRREVVDGRVGVAPADRLDQRRGEVVVPIARAVVAKGPLSCDVGDVGAR